MNLEKLDLGPCKVEYKGVDLGTTKGGVKVKIQKSYVSKVTDQTGDTPADKVEKGTVVEAVVPLAEQTFANLAVALNVSVITTGSTNYVEVKAEAGKSLRSTAGELKITRWVGGQASSDPLDVYHILYAAVEADIELTFDAETQRVYNSKFTGLPHPTTLVMAQIGDNA